MNITTDQIKELRDMTGVSVMQCKKALEEAGGDKEKAIIILRKISSSIAAKKSDRTLAAGTIGVYVHSNGNIASMVELKSETDFVSNNDEFKTLARDIAMHISASSPEFISESQINDSDKVKAREVFAEEAKDKPAEIREKIVEGKLQAYFGEKTLLSQAFIKNPDRTINDLIQDAIQKFGEKIEITRIARFAIGE